MASTTPYIIRAIYDWCTDEGYSPHLLVDANHPDVVVPDAHVADGAIVLNVSASAVRDLELGNDWVMFSARFGGVPMNVNVPVPAVRAIYARETGIGFGFPEDGNIAVPARIGAEQTTDPAASSSTNGSVSLAKGSPAALVEKTPASVSPSASPSKTASKQPAKPTAVDKTPDAGGKSSKKSAAAKKRPQLKLVE